jgi:hypothetical protein
LKHCFTGASPSVSILLSHANSVTESLLNASIIERPAGAEAPVTNTV